VGAPIVPVESAFNGLAVYRLAAIARSGCGYVPYYRITPHSHIQPVVVRGACEHVAFHLCLRRARLRLEESPGRLPVVEELIDEFDVSRTHFFRLFKEQTGQSPYKYHLELKIRRAGEMLRDSNLTVKQISIALGFRNPYHFSRLFRAKTGTSPRDYRHHWRAISSGDGPLATPPA
jgi:transcriptional regulator GlxA family with amidase domain